MRTLRRFVLPFFPGLLLATTLAMPATALAQENNAATTTPPRPVRLVDAAYPPEALRQGVGAIVRLQLDIDATGQVTQVRIRESSGRRDFDEAAATAARDFVFEPAHRGTEAVPARIVWRSVFSPPPARATDEFAPRPLADPNAQHGTNNTTSDTQNTTGSVEQGSTNTQGSTTQAPVEQGVTVYARAPSREINRREVTAEEIRRIPGARGDALLALQNLPGVARPPFGIGQFIVRSSAPEDSLVTLEGQPIVLPFHFGGFASTIATDLIERIEFLPGNFSTRYGRVAGGVINVTLKAPARDRFHAVVDFDPIDIGVYASAPLGFPKADGTLPRASAGIGARRSLIDLIAPPIASATGGTGGVAFRQWPYYWDVQLALDWDITDDDSIRIVAAANEDQLILNFRDPNANDPNFRGTLGTHLAFAGVQMRWRHRFGPNVTHTFAPQFAYNLTAATLGPEVNFTFQSYLAYLRDELEVRLTRGVKLFVGFDGQAGYLDNVVRAPPIPTNGIMDPIDPETVVTYRTTGDSSILFNPSFYMEGEVEPVRALRILAGVRVDYFGLIKSWTVNPRASARLALSDTIELRAGFGQYSTPPRGYFIVPGFGNPRLQPEQWLHASAGINMQLIPGVVEFDTDFFVKIGDHVVAPSSGTRMENGTEVPERFANTGLGRVIGGEWMLRLRPGASSPLYGMISYTYQRATRAACAQQCPWYVYQYDQPHIVSAVLGAILPFGIEVGVRARYTSGTVEPDVTGVIYDADHDVGLTLTDPSNPGRLPGYFSLDWRVSKRFEAGPIHGQFILEVLNSTNNNNPESRIYSYDRRESRLVYGLPIIPSFGIRAEY